MDAATVHTIEQFLPKKILVVEDDPAVQSLIKMTFRDYGIQDVYGFVDGVDAWKELNETNFDLIVLDWQLAGLTGSQLFNRIRQLRAFRSIPLIVVSGYMSDVDHNLIDDFFFSARVEKPFDDNYFMKIAKETLRDKYDFDVIAKKSEMLYFETFDHNVSRPMEVLNGWLQNYGHNPKGVSMVATILRNLHAFDQSRQIILNSMKIHRSNSLLFHQLALTQLMSGDFEQAKENFEKAYDVCSKNQERSIWLGFLEFHFGNFEKGMFYIDTVYAEDPSSPAVSSVFDMINFVKSSFSPDDVKSLRNGVGHCLNRLAWNNVQEGHYQMGEDVYHRAINFCGDRQAKAKIYYNMGVCEARMGHKKPAMSNFFRSIDLFPNYKKSVDALKMFGFEVPYGV